MRCMPAASMSRSHGPMVLSGTVRTWVMPIDRRIAATSAPVTMRRIYPRKANGRRARARRPATERRELPLWGCRVRVRRGCLHGANRIESQADRIPVVRHPVPGVLAAGEECARAHAGPHQHRARRHGEHATERVLDAAAAHRAETATPARALAGRSTSKGILDIEGTKLGLERLQVTETHIGERIEPIGVPVRTQPKTQFHGLSLYRRPEERLREIERRGHSRGHAVVDPLSDTPADP